MTVKTILLVSLAVAVVALAIALIVWLRARRKRREAEEFRVGDMVWIGGGDHGPGRLYYVHDVERGGDQR